MAARGREHWRRKGWHGAKWIRTTKRAAIYDRDNRTCVWCGDDERTIYARGSVLSLDHLVAHARGGTNEASNLVTACLRCNMVRCARSVRRWLKWLETAGWGVVGAAMRLDRAMTTPIAYRERTALLRVGKT